MLGYASSMTGNRIRELWEAKGLTAEELADKVGTTATQIRRLASGSRRLTEGWMRRIARALDVRPADLLREATLADLTSDLEPAAEALNGLAKVLASRGLKAYKIVADSLMDSGFRIGDTVLADHSAEASSKVGTGDFVLVEMRPRGEPTTYPVLAIRMFVAPDMVITNRPGSNATHKFDDDTVEIKIVGVALRPDSDAAH